jgi:LysR family hydrogen peroxide-inducible transcriptional activator
MRLLASLVFSGYGAGIVPASAAPSGIGGDWRRVEVTGVPGRSVGLVRRRRGLPSAAQRAVAQTIVDVVRTESDGPAGIRPTGHVNVPRIPS